MANPKIRPRRSNTAASVPTAGQLAEGELVINVADGKLYSKNAGGSIVQLATTAVTATTSTHLSGGSLGSVPYQSSSGSTSQLSGNTTTTRKVLSQVGNGTISAAPSWYTLTKTDIGLSAVENTELSTWAGSANVSSLGIVSSGTWQASPVAIGYGGTGAMLAGISGGVIYSTPTEMSITASGSDGQVLVSTGFNAPVWESQGIFSAGRLTLESDTPVSITDQSSKSTLYFTPYNGDKISLHNGTYWSTYSFSQPSISNAGLTANKNYDVFAYFSGAEVALEFGTAWASDTVRASDQSIILSNGVYVKYDPITTIVDSTRRYLGTIRSATSSLFHDTSKNRLLWNVNNRVTRPMYIDTYVQYGFGIGHHYYTTAAWRNWNNDANLRVNFLTGIKSPVIAHLGSYGSTAVTSMGIGFDASAPTGGVSTVDVLGRAGRSVTSQGAQMLGFHYAQLVEYAAPGGGTAVYNSAMMDIMFEC